ncbi:WXG100 family type VII secretion target [Actinomyces slackii]|uniref:ESAT-6-like protein n=1 Tax=Actinomyces slackii TaxID=52774 RepID=A0A448KBD3_9ACTO|nr:WXG100 family type VII secretion target [Actinomyces slackii]VEG74226.1 WXG100 family type VII secretion target [Actinomyces slackii]
MPSFAVDTTAVSDTAVRARTRIATIQTEVDGMQSDITFLQGSWTGSASDSMAVCASDWRLTQLQVQANLDQISLALDQAALTYDETETTNAGRFTQSRA